MKIVEAQRLVLKAIADEHGVGVAGDLGTEHARADENMFGVSIGLSSEADRRRGARIGDSGHELNRLVPAGGGPRLQPESLETRRYVARREIEPARAGSAGLGQIVR